MARKPTPTLTDAELKIMEAVWHLGRASVNEVLDYFTDHEKPAYNTILTVMRILEDKGYLGHTKVGRAHIYCPLIDRRNARTKALNQLIKRFFNDSPELLVLNLIEDENIGPEELGKLKKMIADNEAEV